ncbi:hypothetical protein quinque_000034 [Culex quinquefasciatus]
MLNLKISFALLLIATGCCYGKLTRNQLRVLHAAIEECAHDADIRDYQRYELMAVTGRQMARDKRTKQLLLCTVYRMDFLDCDGTMRQDNYAAFISDGHNNLEQLPALMQDCLAKVHGTIEDKAFQVIQCLWASRTFKV